MTGGIVTLLALLGFLAVVVYVFVIKRKEDFDEQARQPLENEADKFNGDSSEDGEKQS